MKEAERRVVLSKKPKGLTKECRDSWTAGGKLVYKEVLDAGEVIFENDWFHPETPAIKRPCWETITHNIGFLVAERLLDMHNNLEAKRANMKPTNKVKPIKKAKPISKVTKKHA